MKCELPCVLRCGQIALWAVVFLGGCGGAKEVPNRPKTVPAKGVVTYKGQPVEGATVTFMAQSAKEKGATGMTDAKGQFQLMTFAPGDGAVPGSYRVKVSKTEMKPQVSEEQEKSLKSSGKRVPPPIVQEGLPKKYKSETTSGLTAEVKESGDNAFTFELKDGP